MPEHSTERATNMQKGVCGCQLMIYWQLKFLSVLPKAVRYTYNCLPQASATTSITWNLREALEELVM